MRSPRRHPEFPPPESWAYPEHLRPWVEPLPTAPGVYIFHGEPGDLPLYIGKSVNLRSRVLAHLRNPDEARLLRQTRSITHQRTAGDLGAQLLEAQLIKQQQPLLNQKLRRTRTLCAWHVPLQGEPRLVHSNDLDFAVTPELFGLYSSRHAAIEALRDLADAHRLCWGALGLEKSVLGRPCFRASLRRCQGVCAGHESRQDHDERLHTALAALRVNCWPHPGAIGLIEDDGEMRQIHVVRHWCYLGSVDTPALAQRLAQVAAGFDADGYRILCRPLLTGTLEILPL